MWQVCGTKPFSGGLFRRWTAATEELFAATYDWTRAHSVAEVALEKNKQVLFCPLILSSHPSSHPDAAHPGDPRSLHPSSHPDAAHPSPHPEKPRRKTVTRRRTATYASVPDGRLHAEVYPTDDFREGGAEVS